MKIERQPSRFGWLYRCFDCKEIMDELEGGLKHPTRKDRWPLPWFLSPKLSCPHAGKVVEYPFDPPLEAKEINPHL